MCLVAEAEEWLARAEASNSNSKIRNQENLKEWRTNTDRLALQQLNLEQLFLSCPAVSGFTVSEVIIAERTVGENNSVL